MTRTSPRIYPVITAFEPVTVTLCVHKDDYDVLVKSRDEQPEAGRVDAWVEATHTVGRFRLAVIYAAHERNFGDDAPHGPAVRAATETEERLAKDLASRIALNAAGVGLEAITTPDPPASGDGQQTVDRLIDTFKPRAIDPVSALRTDYAPPFVSTPDATSAWPTRERVKALLVKHCDGGFYDTADSVLAMFEPWRKR